MLWFINKQIGTQGILNEVSQTTITKQNASYTKVYLCI